jgi:predicted dehydrogenase
VLQVVQKLREGRVEVVDVPEPVLLPEGVLVDVHRSLLSSGTERSKVEAGRKSLVGKARSRPDQVKQVLDKARRDGVRDTVRAVQTRLSEPTGLGYSAAGVVRAVGSKVRDLSPGDRVACGGGGYAMHAEVDYVPGQLCVRLPDEVSFDEGAFATVGAVAMHGVRQADVRIGERVAVIGLGLVGQLTGQILRAAGCTVVGIDLSADLVAVAKEAGAADSAYERSSLQGSLPLDALECDAVIIAAAASSSDPFELAPRLCRDRGRVVLVGDVPPQFPRAPYYDKELDVRLSRSYGPGRYDREYEERGLDYPIGYVRWTERRNMQAFVDLVATSRLDVRALVSERVPVGRADEAYEGLVHATRSPLAILLEYPIRESTRIAAVEPAPGAAPTASTTDVGVIGAGSFSGRVLMPALQAAGFTLKAVAGAQGLSAVSAADRLGIGRASTPDEVLADLSIGLVVVATRHDSHAALAAAALRSGKAVFVEKPPALSLDELSQLRRAQAETGLPLQVGFNRRFAPLAVELRKHIRDCGGPIEMTFRINAGPLDPGHWVNDPQTGGGRLLGEGCHFVDFASWIVGEPPTDVSAHLSAGKGLIAAEAQSFVVNLGYADGSLATILYSAGGASGLSKEAIEAHSCGRSAKLDDFRALALYEGRKRRTVRGRGQDKGHRAQFQYLRGFLAGTEKEPVPSPLDTMAATLHASEAAATGKTVRLQFHSGGWSLS